MKSLLFLLLALTAAAQIPAFPGAEGYGAYAKGGRGTTSGTGTGDVYIVTNLNSSGAGSLAEGIATAPSGGRTIVFAVSGYIHVPGSNLRITQNKITIAGQTAPGDGIGLRNGTFRISADDIVIRHLRFRHGKNGSGGDCIDLDSGCQNAILDHISMAFSTDENISSFGSPPENLTMQWALNAWGLESHSCGGLWDQNHATCHHTLWAHNHTRNPKARPAGLLEWVNNVTFDWDIGFIMGDSQTPAGWKSNVVGNYFICPPGNIRNTPLEKASLDRNGYPNFSVHVANNLHDRDGDGLLNGTDRGYSIVGGSAYNAATNPTGNYIQLASPYANTGSLTVTTDPALLAYKKILSNAGPLRLDASHPGPLRDEVDTRLLQNLANQTANHITRESDLAGVSNSGFGTLASATAPIDTDRDAMPDAYETALGWNPATQDHNTTVSGTTYFPAGSASGYTRLEEYLHFKAVPHAFVVKSGSLIVDLSRYTAGFTNAPAFTLTGIGGGSATQSGPGNRIVTFNTQASAGRGGFLFTVTDTEGSTWTQQFLICVTNNSAPADLDWRGTAGDWDTTSNNWLNDGTPVAFTSGDRVRFGDTGSASPAINLPAAVLATTVEVDSSANYSFNGAGAISTTNALTKRGSGNLTINNTGTNSFNSVSIEQGTLALNTAAAAGTAKISLNGGSLALAPPSNSTLGNLLEFNQPATITIGSQHAIGGSWTGTQPLTLHATANQLWTIGGTWSGFTGRIVAGSGNPRIRLNGNSNLNFGSAAVAVDLGSGTSQLMNRNGSATTPFEIGELTSTSSGTTLSGTQTGTVVSTYNIGGLNTTATFAGAIVNGGGATNLNKVGSGTWTLTGSSTYSGITGVNAGTLRVNGTLGNTATTVANGAILGGSGSIGGLVTAASGSTLDPGPSQGHAGTLSTGAGLTLNGTSNIRYDLSGSPAGANDRINVSSGTLTLSGATVNLHVSATEGVLGNGTYPLIDGAATMAANPAPALNLVGLPPGSRQTFAVQRQSSGGSPAFVNLVVSGTPPASLVWSGTAGGGLWDLDTTANFTSGPTPTFFNLDAVIFDDSSPVGTVMLNGTLQPRAITISNSTRAYTFDGIGMIAGSTSLVKTGNGLLTLLPDILSLSSTTTSGSNQVTVTDAASLAPGMVVMGGGFPYGTTITGISGNTLTMSATTATAATATLTYHTRHSYSGGTSIAIGSTIQLGNEAANRWGLGTGAVTFLGGTLRMHDSGTGLPGAGDLPNALIVPAGQSGTLHSPQRGSLSGTLSGAGTLNLVVSYVRGDFYGDWSAFTGQLNVSSATGSEFRMAENYTPDGFPNASLYLGASVAMKHTGILNQGAGTSIRIGQLSGASGSTLLGGVTGGRALTYLIGAKGGSTTFAGTIAEQIPGSTLTNIVKQGSGTWTLSGTGVWAGGTTVEQGTLEITGSVTSNSAVNVASAAFLKISGGSLATDVVSLDSGASMTAYGTLSADLNVNGTLEGRGFASGPSGTLAVHGSAFLGAGSLTKLRSTDLLAVSGDLALGGTIQIALAPGTGFGRYPLISYGGTLSGSASLIGIPSGTTAHLSTLMPGQVVLVIDDSDEDGLPDSWELSSFGNLAQASTDDTDLDGSSNLVEWRLGLDPAHGGSAFRTSVSGRTLVWPSAPGVVFTVKRRLALGSGTWEPIGTVTGGIGSTASFTDPASFSRAFYRVEFTP
ncbi:autotransporter-associated beta strand repeat-containing protein [Luteolibacter sp. GHJ8]|uniref:Autotransporter-associated beta strand repeat-containing protein n=1 Tax=Luteolibacter rhizosphaerae TaxID=2989719 RepID=A0ABT3G2I2_9BACT|nr:autotransporter-associated beta strand repeat-containing protein [Luteolibacter rhizosphaerae]MCW1914050.1 autotransporter-associated beta strand repeat-containing protein [Luteolibacter rhizosphaerae]